MAFHISVYRLADAELLNHPPEDMGSPDFERWEALCLERTLYENPLGADGIVYHYWLLPAVELGLPLMAAIYHSGLSVSGADLSLLESELHRLENHWATMPLENEPPMLESTHHEDGRREEKELSLTEHLQQCAGYLREAIAVARANDGVVDIG